jgi:hypothetical protein
MSIFFQEKNNKITKAQEREVPHFKREQQQKKRAL